MGRPQTSEPGNSMSVAPFRAAGTCGRGVDSALRPCSIAPQSGGESSAVLPANTGIMLCGHGSRDEGAVREFGVVADVLRTRFPDNMVEHGFLEFARPLVSSNPEARSCGSKTECQPE